MDIEHPEFLNFLKCAYKNGLRYMCIGGYAVNFYGYSRSTQDLDIWIAPTNENKIKLFDTLLCMGFVAEEFESIINEDFTTHFIFSIGSMPYVIDILTIAHQNINFDIVEKDKVEHKLENETVINFVPYEILIKTKLLARRPKDLLDITELEKLINKK